MNLLINR